MTPHPNPHLTADTDDAARSWARYRDGLERASRSATAEHLVDEFLAEYRATEEADWDDYMNVAHRGIPVPSQPPLRARDHLALFARSALVMLIVVAVLLACAWIGEGR